MVVKKSREVICRVHDPDDVVPGRICGRPLPCRDHSPKQQNFFRIRHYLVWLEQERFRIENGGIWEPWLTRDESLARIRSEIHYCEKYLASEYSISKRGITGTIPKQYRRNRKGFEQG